MQPVKWTPRGVFLSVLIVLCGVTSLQSQRIREPRAVKAVDALGKEIGTVLKMDFTLQRMQVAVEVNETLVPILVSKDSFSHGSRPIAYFASADCAGVAHLGSGSEDSLGPPVGVAGPRATLYRGYPETMQLREILSALFGAECKKFEASLMVMDADPLMDLADHFTPPFGIASAGEEDRSGRGPTDAPIKKTKDKGDS